MNKKLISFLLLVIIVFILQIGCSSNSINEYENLQSNISLSSNFTAFNSYDAALTQAKKWKENAVLYQIPINSIMASNLGIPPSPEGWYFMFQDMDSPLELFIEVINGKVTGYTEAQPIITDKDLIKTEIIGSIDGLIDSDEVIALMNKNIDREIIDSYKSIELALYKYKSYKNPIWTIFGSLDDSKTPIAFYQFDAVTGESLKELIQ